MVSEDVQMSLEEAIDMYCTDTLPISSWLKDLPATLSETEMSELKCYMRKKAECLSELTDDIRIATECGEKILQELDTGRDLSDIDPVMLNRYDEVYDTIINSEKATLLIYYCGDILMNYITEALKFEKSGDVRAKVKMEQQLFGMFGEKIPELVSYINELF